MSVERIIGIDFGTSTSVIRVKRYNNGQPVEDRLSKQDVIFNGSRPTVPTLIQRTDKGTYYGYDAQVSKKGETLYQNFKMNLENCDLAKKQEARELTEEFFAYLAKTYKSQSEGGHFGDSGDDERTIVSYPVKWSEDTKEFMLQTAEKAGFQNVEGMDEAQAAIHAVTVQSEDFLTKHGFFTAGVPCNILLVDMGAGTTDLVLCRHTPGEKPKNEILCTWPKEGDALFGGREVDELLREYVRSLLPEDMAPMVLKKNGAKEFKAWKESVVSPALERSETVEEFSSIDNVVELLEVEMEPYDLDRARFEELAEEYLGGFPKLIADCIDHSGIQKEDVDLVILTGGHSQWYFVKEMLEGRGNIDLPKIKINPERIIPITRPQETVALGMVYRPLSAEFEKMSGDIAAYYQKNVNLLFTVANAYTVIAVKSDGTVMCDGSLDGNSSAKSVIAGWRDIVAISSSGGDVVGLKKDGTVVAAGDNEYGQCNVQGWRDVVAISCGGEHTVGLKKDGTVVATGDNEYGQCNVVWDWRDVVAISCGESHTVGLKKDGTVVAVGNNDCGQCNVREWRDIVSILCGCDRTVGLKRDGTVVATGYNDGGACNVQWWRDVVAISCGESHTVGLKKDGTVVAAGGNDCGQCNVQDWRDVVAVSCSPWHTVGLKKDGTVVATGSNQDNECNVQNWCDMIAVVAVDHKTYGIKKDGSVICTEKMSPTSRTLPSNLFHETSGSSREETIERRVHVEAPTRSTTGNAVDAPTQSTTGNTVVVSAQGTTENTIAAPAQGAGENDIIAYYQKNANSLISICWDNALLSVKYDQMLAVKLDGAVVCDGPVGSKIKSAVAGWNDISSIAYGISHAVGLRRDGTVVAVGLGGHGQCNVQDWEDVVAISCGNFYTVGLKKDGTVVAKGDNGNDQCNVQGWRDIISISCGACHTVGLKRDGTVVATGGNGDGRCNVQGWEDIISISCGEYHTVGLKRDGTVVATGSNAEGQCNVQDWRDIVAVSCGGLYTVGLKRDGTVVATEKNNCGQCNVGSWHDMIAVVAGNTRTYGIKRDGSVISTDYRREIIKATPSSAPRTLPFKLF